MRLWLTARLVALVYKLSPFECHLVFVWHDPLFDRAKALTAEWEDHESSGEHKRHQVYAQLIKEFPERSKRAIALCLEVARV